MAPAFDSLRQRPRIDYVARWAILKRLERRDREWYRKHAPKAELLPYEVQCLSDYFSLLDGFLSARSERFWYRGHADGTWRLCPNALRLREIRQRARAIDLLAEFRRLALLRLPRDDRPPYGDMLQWLGLAQHYGLPTRLLDWTENPAIALYFAVLAPDLHGAVILMNPVELNRRATRQPRIFDNTHDADLLSKYLSLGAKQDARGPRTVAVHPVYNTPRIIAQKGAFTLHGSRDFDLDTQQAPSLVCIPILSGWKQKLATELSRIGVDEMTIFPETEHLCAHLRRTAELA
jgi:FRG domain